MDKYEYLWTKIRNNMLPGDISGCAGFLQEAEYEECENMESKNVECKNGYSKNLRENTYLYEEILKMSEHELKNIIGLKSKQIEYIMSTKMKYDADLEYDKFIKSGAKAVTMRDREYPQKLRFIDNAPYALFYYGDLPKEDKKSVAIIGSRECSDYGRLMTENIASFIAKENINIISGMAYGIDGISQMSALNAGGKSYAVIGSGVDICYPRANREIYERLKCEGGIISEYPLKSPAMAANFPMRNRIISGLADVVIVVEARLKSGTFITVDYALSQGKEIMVVPGRATDPLSCGCNALLTQGANLCQSGEDVLRLLDSLNQAYFEQKNIGNTFRTKELENLVPKASKKILLDREENMVYSVLDFYARSPEELSVLANMDIFRVMGILISLELKGVAKEMGKSLYVKCM